LDHGRNLDVSPKKHLTDHRLGLRRSRPAHWPWTRGYYQHSHRFGRRWLPRVREKRRSRHALERTPLGLFG
jgi:hypothetical protein